MASSIISAPTPPQCISNSKDGFDHLLRQRHCKFQLLWLILAFSVCLAKMSIFQSNDIVSELLYSPPPPCS